MRTFSFKEIKEIIPEVSGYTLAQWIRSFGIGEKSGKGKRKEYTLKQVRDLFTIHCLMESGASWAQAEQMIELFDEEGPITDRFMRYEPMRDRINEAFSNRINNYQRESGYEIETTDQSTD